MPDTQYWIDALGLIKHPEGGYFQENYRCPETISLNTGTPFQKRNLASSIYFLLPGNEVSCFHRLRYDEIWYYHVGSPLIIYRIDDHGKLTQSKLGLNAGQDEWPQVVVPRGSIFGAVVCEADSYTLMGCVVSPGFDYRDFELLPRKMLVGQYPQYRELILKLTRDEK